MILIPTHKTLEESWDLSANMWKQVAPPTEGKTQFLVRPQEHPITGEWYFEMDELEANRFDLDVDNALTEWPDPDDDYGESDWFDSDDYDDDNDNDKLDLV